VVPKTVTCVPQRKQIFVSRLNPDLSSLDITAYIRNKVQIDDLKVERFNFPYAREVSSFKIGVPCAYFALFLCSANFWPVGIFVKEFEAKKKKKIRSKEVGNPFKEPSTSTSLSISKNYILFFSFPIRIQEVYKES